MERNEHAATVERLRRLNRNGYAVRAEFAAYKLNLRESDVKQAVDSLKRRGRIVVTGGVHKSVVKIVD